ncbi:MAG: hypothetical protein NUW09_00560 [Deltaproteobacteria bacterium]|nr:hypothetical protein [Deltaproteobacteria bacterium]
MDKSAGNKASPTYDGGKVAAYSTLINIALSAAKALVAFSADVLTEAVHSLMDVIASFSVWTGALKCEFTFITTALIVHLL